MKRKDFFGTAEFAALCGTTKETLFHYDRIGLLRPRRVSGNGYRSYAAEQFFEFDLIGVLKDAGSSLEEIKAYLSEYDPENFLKILEEKRLLLEKEQARLARRQESLRHIAEATRAALAGQVGKLEIMELEAEGLIAVRTNPEEEWSWSYMASYMRDHFRHCEAIGLSSVFPLGCIVERERILAGRIMESYYFSPARGLRQSERYLEKPGGRYAVLLHRGDYDSLYAALPALLTEIEGQGLKVGGRVYIYDLLSYLASEKEENDVHRVEIPLEPGP